MFNPISLVERSSGRSSSNPPMSSRYSTHNHSGANRTIAGRLSGIHSHSAANVMSESAYSGNGIDPQRAGSASPPPPPHRDYSLRALAAFGISTGEHNNNREGHSDTNLSGNNDNNNIHSAANAGSGGLNSFLSTFGLRHNNNNNNNSHSTSAPPFANSLANPVSESPTAFPSRTDVELLGSGNENENENNNNNDNVRSHPHPLSHSYTVPFQSQTQLPIALSLTTNNISTTSNSMQFSHNVTNNSGTNGNTNNIYATGIGVADNNNNNDSVINGAFAHPVNDQQLNLQPNTNSNTNAKNIRHYIYAADQPNADSLLNLDLPPNTVLPKPPSEKELRQRKDKNGLFSIRLTPFIDTSSSTANQGLYFDPIIRTAGPGSQLVIGRYTERVREAISKLPEHYHPVVFKSKVVSRTHGCFKVDSYGNWFVKDVKSSSGTFLNHQRLAPASTLSKDVLLHDGDILQLGMDFRGGTEEIYRCVRMKVELNRSWKRKANAFNKAALQRIRNLQRLGTGFTSESLVGDATGGNGSSINSAIDQEDCSVCLGKIQPCQAIFISPCSHSWHFHCIRRLVLMSYPQFVCPNCRATCDLEASLESSDSDLDFEEDEGEEREGDQVSGSGQNRDNTAGAGNISGDDMQVDDVGSHGTGEGENTAANKVSMPGQKGDIVMEN